MGFRRLSPRQSAYAADASISSSTLSTTSFHCTAMPVCKANILMIAIGCALVGIASVLVPNPALAAEFATSTVSQEYAIPAGRLSDVLAQFAATSSVPLSFDPQVLAGLRSNGLQGRYSVRDGFSLLLAGSGYELVDTGGGRYSLRQVIAESGAVMLAPVT